MKGQLRIETISAFIVLDDDGTEGIPAFMGPGGMAMPMVAADEARVHDLRLIAEEIARDMGKKVTLARFSVREDLEVLNP